MPADYAETLHLVRRAISRGTPLADAWQAVVQHISPDLGADVALRLQVLDVAAEIQRLESWLHSVLVQSPPQQALRGLRFGLFHPEVAGRPSCDLYLAGSRAFDEDSDVWARDPVYLAATNPHSQVLDELSLIALDDHFAEHGPVVHLCLWFALLAVAELCRRNSAVLGPPGRRRGVAVGFDGGDLITVGVFAKSRFSPYSDTGKRPRRRQKLLPGEYFKLEGGRDLLLCNCTDASLPSDLFRAAGPLDLVSLTATIHPDWPNQCGTLGVLYPFTCEFLTAAAAELVTAAFPHEVQFHPLRIVGRAEEWRVMKVLNCVPCLNYEESQRQQRVILQTDTIGGRHIFFVTGYYEGRCVLVSRPVAQLLIDEGVLGAEFIPVGTS